MAHADRPLHVVLRGLAIAAVVLVYGAAHAAWPDKAITLVVPFPPGGNTDAMGRILAKQLTASLGTTVIVENKPGAGSMLGSQYVARATPDGYTLLVGSISNALNHYFYRKPLYDITKDLVPISQLVNVPNYLAVGPKEKFRSTTDIVDFAKANPGKLSCATTGIGTSPYLSCELFKSLAGINIVNVPYKGGAAAMQDAMGGQVAMVFANEALPLINSKRLIGIAVTTKERSPLAPDLPAISETVPGYDVTAWYGVFAPTGTPQAIVDRLGAEISAAIKDPAVATQLKNLGATPVGSTPKEFSAFMSSQLTHWADVIKPMNIFLD
ncbi:MAG: tripartite tricarboxylate transporter substrate binding protein [Pseudomonadota bacterium]|nr:tripartite tricarboxylate transporter substrate binding protein [Pseudomonadota bacterium]